MDWEQERGGGRGVQERCVCAHMFVLMCDCVASCTCSIEISRERHMVRAANWQRGSLQKQQKRMG